MLIASREVLFIITLNPGTFIPHGLFHKSIHLLHGCLRVLIWIWGTSIYGVLCSAGNESDETTTLDMRDAGS